MGKFASTIQSLQAEDAQRAGLAVEQGPDEMGRALSIARERGAPPLAVAANLPDFEAEEHRNALDAAVKADAGLGAWLGQPEHATLARDDLPALSKLSGAINRTNASLMGLLGFVSPQGFQALNAVRRGVERSRFAEQANTGIMAAASSVIEAGSEFLAPVNQTNELVFGRMMGVTDPDVLDPLHIKRAGETAAAVGQEVRREQQALGEQVGGRPTLAQFTENPAAALEQAVAHYVGLGGQSAPLFGVALATRSPAVGGAILGGTSGAQEFSSLRAQGVGDFEAAQSALLSAGVESQFERIGLGALLGRWKGSVLASPFVEGGTEALTAIAQTNISDQATGNRTTVGAQLSQAFDAAVVGTGMGAPIALARAAVQGGPSPVGARDELQTLARVASSAEQASRLEAITAAAAESKTGKRAAEALGALAPDETVFIPAEAVRTLYQSDDVLGFVESLTGDANALDVAGQHGDLAVPMAKWVSVVSQLPNAAEWAKHARSDLEGYSRADLDGIDLDAELAGIDTFEAAERATPEQQEASDRIEQDVMGMLVSADRYRPADAELQAKFMARVFRVMGQRAGMDPWALYERYKLRINGRGGRQGSTLDPRTDAIINAVRTGTIPESREVFGSSLVQFLRGEHRDENGRVTSGIRDEGGELAAMDARIASVGLMNRNGVDLDTARELAVEAGYLPEGADINDLLEAIRGELMGQPVYSPQSVDPKREAFRNEALQLAEAFDEKFRDTPREELDKMTNQQVFDLLMGEGQRSVLGRVVDGVKSLYQAAFHGSPHRGIEQTGFSLQKIGTGEGAQAYGWGLYFASAREVAEAYRDALAPVRPAEYVVDGRVEFTGSAKSPYELAIYYKANGGKDWADHAEQMRVQGANESYVAKFEEISRELEGKTVERRDPPSGNLYQVEVPEDSDLLDWDKPLSEQPEKVRAAVEAVLAGDSLDSEARREWEAASDEQKTGKRLYTILQQSDNVDGARGASETLLAAGIPGLRYLDGNSRAGGEGSHNYVIWDESAINDVRTLYQSSRPAAPTQDQSGVESAHAQQDLESRIAQWAASIHLGGSGPRAVAASPESVGPVARNASGAAEQGDESRETLREQSGRLIERAKAEGFFWPNSSPIFAEIEKLPTLGGAEHQVFVVGEGDSRLIIRATDNGYFGPRADISPAQYLARLDDYSATFPNLQTRLIGVSESTEIEGHAVIWTAQPFVYGKKFMHQSRLAEAMAAHGWKEDGTFRFVHEATGAVIEDAHTDNVFRAANGDLYPFDVVVEVLPKRTLEQPADGGTGPRGSLDIGADRSMAINLFAGANLSTFLHESGHFFLEVMRDVATGPNAPQAVRDDWQAILAYLGNDGGEITTEQHETWARSFEAYLMEGQAPAPELLGAFARFRAWLVSIYRALSALNVNLTPEVRSVMDRMIATDEEIEAAQVKQGMTPLELPPESRALVSDAQWAQYVAALQAGTEEARQEVFAKLVTAHKRAAERWYKEETARTREEVEAELDALPIMRAWRILRGSRDESIPENLRGLKLDRDAIAGMFDPDTGKRMLERLRAMYRKEGGVSPDTAAALLGFTSGDELVRKLAGVPDLLAQVEQEVQARMQEKHPDPLLDGNVPDMAMAAVHNNKRLQAMDAELGLLATLANQPRPNRRALKAIAERVIAGKTIRSLRPNQHLVAERKAAREATKAAAAGNYAEALAAKREQALQAALYAEALRAQERAERQIEALRKAGTDKTRERIGKAGKVYVDALDDLLEGHDLKPASAREVARRASLRAWVAQQQEADNHTAVSEELLARVERENVVNVRDLTAAQLADLHEAVKNLLHLASVKNRLQTRRGKLDWEEAKGLLRDRLAEQDGRGGGISASDRALLDGLQDLGSAVGNWVLQPETVVEWLDGGVEGPWHDLLWEPSEEAEHAREALQREVGAKLEAAFNALPKDQRKALDRRHYIASLGESVSGHTILSALLNMGTASNRDKLLRGGRVNGDTTTPFTPEQLAEMFSKLSGSQAQLVQGIWDAVHTLWPHVVALEEELNGITPEKIEAEPVTITTADGPVTLRGGYFPAAYDPRGAKVGRMAEEEQAKRVLSGGLPIKASTSKGHVEKRTDFVAPLLLDYHAVLTRHLDGVMSDLAYRKFLKQAYKILDDAELARMIDNRVGTNATKVLKSGMERGAVGAFSLAGPLFGPFQGIADGTMTNVSAAALGLRVPLALANIITSPILAAARVSPRFVAEGFAAYYRNPKAGARMVQRLSPMMLRRAEARTVEWRSMLDNLRGKRGLRRQMIEFTMSVHQWIVPLAENAIWIGAYHEALAGGQDASEAVRLADKAIRQTQTKHTAKDLSLAEGSPYLRWAMMFAGPLAVINNRLQESGLRGLRGAVNSPVQAIATWAAMAAGGVWVFELLMGRGPGDEDDDGDEDVADWARWCAVKLGLMPFAAYPILRDIGSAIDQGFARSNPLVDAGMSLWRFGQTAWESGEALFDGGDVDEEKLAKDTTRAIGTVTGLPSGQAVRSGTYFMEVATGQHTPANPAAEAVYLLQGPPKE